LFGDVNNNPYLCIVDVAQDPIKGWTLLLRAREWTPSCFIYYIKNNISPYFVGYMIGVYYLCGMRKFLKIVFLGYIISGIAEAFTKKKVL
jgi:hypothetical protein